ncbi:S8 family serine peptidase [Phocaeicola sp.]|uniref:S8 family peptidase n=1 Tax=Phocaeicola sp. TaxID=2773926 RepID=UPI0023D534A6|nr:S8 family serine peptidase [Phocaeicola sp.]MDE5678389.1 S8 family serine peptidase [Phocaeicola sp.]
MDNWKRIWGCMLAACALQVSAQVGTYKYRVNLRDKAETTYTLHNPSEYLSGRALERRARQGLAVDSADLPVCRTYMDMLAAKGAKPVSKSKWNNTVVVHVADTLVMDEVAALPFVAAVRRVWTAPDSIPARNAARKKEVTNKVVKEESYYGDAWRQMAVHRGDSLHAAGFRGEGMHIAVIDAGFYNADEIGLFKKMNLLGTRDFVNPRSDIYAENAHGMKVLSCMAANKPHVLVGTAPAASYWLLRSEDNDTEQPVEEDYWAEALEFADSVGVDVVNTSLGYYEFDDAAMNYRYRDLDGHYSLMSHSASLAAAKGMVLVCSAGNSGRGTWKKITPPGDAEEVITVGAMDRNGVNADFSSVGNTADGRVKPDVMAVGVFSAVSGNDGTVSHANGTSFASPTFCGLVACFWQACPWLTARQVVKAVQEAGDRKDCPDNIYGYGVPDMWKAYQTALKKK